MRTLQESISKKQRSTRLFIMTQLLILLSVTAWAQQSGLTQSEKQTAYTNALLDSVYRYEKLKPVLYNLRSAYTHQGKQVDDLKIALELSRSQIRIQEKEIVNARINDTRKFWFKGIMQGVVIGAVAGIFLVK